MPHLTPEMYEEVRQELSPLPGHLRINRPLNVPGQPRQATFTEHLPREDQLPEGEMSALDPLHRTETEPENKTESEMSGQASAPGGAQLPPHNHDSSEDGDGNAVQTQMNQEPSESEFDLQVGSHFTRLSLSDRRKLTLRAQSTTSEDRSGNTDGGVSLTNPTLLEGETWAKSSKVGDIKDNDHSQTSSSGATGAAAKDSDRSESDLSFSEMVLCSCGRVPQGLLARRT